MGANISRNPNAEISRDPNWSVVPPDGVTAHETVEVSIVFTCERDANGDLVPRSGGLAIEERDLPSDIERLGETILALLEIHEAREGHSDELPPAPPQVA